MRMRRTNRPMCGRAQGVNATLGAYSERSDELVRSVPNQPPLSDLTSDLAVRSSKTADKGTQLQPALVEWLNQPSKIATAAVSDFNDDLESLLNDLKSQERRGPELAKLLARGPLGDLGRQINSTLAGVAGSVEARACPPREHAGRASCGCLSRRRQLSQQLRCRTHAVLPRASAPCLDSCTPVTHLHATASTLSSSQIGRAHV